MMLFKSAPIMLIAGIYLNNMSVILFSILYYVSSKKCGQSVYIRTFGLGLPSLPIYAECPHRYVRTFAIFRKVITMVQD